jgi:D-alanine--poly(phosphoribitol) ligase subunit 2
MSLAETVLRLLHDITDDPRVHTDLDLPLFDKGVIDSLATVELMVSFSEEFGIEISPADVDRASWATPRLMIEDLTRRVSVGSAV